MKHTTGFLILLLLLNACARVGRPTGGDKDVTPPQLLSSEPKHGATGFKGHEIILHFNEYVTIKNPEKNILISPPFNNMPVIKPAGIASKTFKIILKDSLLPNTTYQINFGESIADFNEGNKLEHLQLVFSTGLTIDSLTLKGIVNPVYYNEKKPKKMLIGLYPAKSFKDSLIYNTKPYYVGLTDEKGHFKLNHLKAGKYTIIALDDVNSDYKYQPGKEGVGFLNQMITIPKDSVVSLNLFKEQPAFSIEKITQHSKNHIVIDYKGSRDSLRIKLNIPVTDSLLSVDYQKAHLWYKSPSDSIKLSISVKNRLKKFFRKRSEDIDSLMIDLSGNQRFNPIDTLFIAANMPLIKIDSSKIIFQKDSLKTAFHLKRYRNRYLLDFNKQTGHTYQLSLLPKAVTGFLGQQNKDTIRTQIKIPKAETYGTLLIHINTKQNMPLFVEVIKNHKIIRKTPTRHTSDFEIKYLPAGRYNIRVVFDDNANNRWDPGSYLKHQQPERTFEPAQPVEIRANWEVNQTYNID